MGWGGGGEWWGGGGEVGRGVAEGERVSGELEGEEWGRVGEGRGEGVRGRVEEREGARVGKVDGRCAIPQICYPLPHPPP